MNCAWTSFVGVLPSWMRKDIETNYRDSLLELRMRVDQQPELVTKNGAYWLMQKVSIKDLAHCINMASQYSPWSAWTTQYGYLTLSGGHRIGICGQAAIRDGIMTGIVEPTSICIRIARDYKALIYDHRYLKGSVLIVGKPGNGKTTLLRDLIRFRADRNTDAIAVVDEKQELFPVEKGKFCFSPGKRTDVISGCSKAQGIDCVLRNMGAHTIAVDEITSENDCQALIKAGNCGVDLLATAHAVCREDLYQRPVYQPLIQSRIFQHLIVLQDDKSWKPERMYQ